MKKKTKKKLKKSKKKSWKSEKKNKNNQETKKKLSKDYSKTKPEDCSNPHLGPIRQLQKPFLGLSPSRIPPNTSQKKWLRVLSSREDQNFKPKNSKMKRLWCRSDLMLIDDYDRHVLRSTAVAGSCGRCSAPGMADVSSCGSLHGGARWCDCCVDPASLVVDADFRAYWPLRFWPWKSLMTRRLIQLVGWRLTMSPLRSNEADEKSSPSFEDWSLRLTLGTSQDLGFRWSQ